MLVGLDDCYEIFKNKILWAMSQITAFNVIGNTY